MADYPDEALLPCCYHIVAMLLPCVCVAIMLPPCCCHNVSLCRGVLVAECTDGALGALLPALRRLPLSVLVKANAKVR